MPPRLRPALRLGPLPSARAGVLPAPVPRALGRAAVVPQPRCQVRAPQPGGGQVPRGGCGCLGWRGSCWGWLLGAGKGGTLRDFCSHFVFLSAGAQVALLVLLSLRGCSILPIHLVPPFLLVLKRRGYHCRVLKSITEKHPVTVRMLGFYSFAGLP